MKGIYLLAQVCFGEVKTRLCSKCILFCPDYGHGKTLLTNTAIKRPVPHIRHHSDFVVVAIPLSFLHENNEDLALQDLRKLRLTIVAVCSFVFNFRTPSRDIKI